MCSLLRNKKSITRNQDPEFGNTSILPFRLHEPSFGLPEAGWQESVLRRRVEQSEGARSKNSSTFSPRHQMWPCERAAANVTVWKGSGGICGHTVFCVCFSVLGAYTRMIGRYSLNLTLDSFLEELCLRSLDVKEVLYWKSNLPYIKYSTTVSEWPAPISLRTVIPQIVSVCPSKGRNWWTPLIVVTVSRKEMIRWAKVPRG